MENSITLIFFLNEAFPKHVLLHMFDYFRSSKLPCAVLKRAVKAEIYSLKNWFIAFIAIKQVVVIAEIFLLL